VIACIISEGEGGRLCRVTHNCRCGLLGKAAVGDGQISLLAHLTVWEEHFNNFFRIRRGVLAVSVRRLERSRGAFVSYFLRYFIYFSISRAFQFFEMIISVYSSFFFPTSSPHGRKNVSHCQYRLLLPRFVLHGMSLIIPLFTFSIVPQLRLLIDHPTRNSSHSSSLEHYRPLVRPSNPDPTFSQFPCFFFKGRRRLGT
jgi:hypothetical protein